MLVRNRVKHANCRGAVTLDSHSVHMLMKQCMCPAVIYCCHLLSKMSSVTQIQMLALHA